MPTHSAHEWMGKREPRGDIEAETTTNSSHFYMTMVIARDGLLHHQKSGQENKKTYGNKELTVLALRNEFFVNLITVFVNFQYKVGRLFDCYSINACH